MTVRIINADVLQGLAQLPDESVHCVVTSPPYWGLRDYGTGRWIGGDADCGHANVRRAHGEEKQASSAGTSRDKITGGDCRKCGARRVDDQIGLEPTLQAHLAKLVEVFRQVRRVLRKDGTLWLNYGDAYASSPNGRKAADIVNDDRSFRDKPLNTIGGTIKSKDLMMMPERLAIALQDDGWYVRSRIIWHKPNPMPESIKDRPTKSHEHIWLMAKSPRYFYDAAAIAEDATYGEPNSPGAIKSPYGQGFTRRAVAQHKQVAMGRDLSKSALGSNDPYVTRNARDVWTIATNPFPEAHFATFPPELAERCIRAGTSELGCCAACGAPWERWSNGGNIGWQPTCECYLREDGTHACGDYEVRKSEAVPCLVLDPFGGSGTTGLVADRLQRDAILIELNPAYAEMARKRLATDAGMFSTVALEAAE